jgi:hypothetical protein
MPTLIDVDKVTQAFDYLSETDQGRNALAQLQDALTKFRSQIQPAPNRGEFVYICRGLMDGLNVHESPPPAEVSGFATQQFQIPGALFAGQPGALRRAQTPTLVAQGLLRTNLSGFNLRFVA